MTNKKDTPTEISTESQPKLKKKRKDRRVESEYYDEVEFTDPSTGKKIKQKVKVTKYKTKGDRFNRKPVISEEELNYELSTEEDI